MQIGSAEFEIWSKIKRILTVKKCTYDPPPGPNLMGFTWLDGQIKWKNGFRTLFYLYLCYHFYLIVKTSLLKKIGGNTHFFPYENFPKGNFPMAVYGEFGQISNQPFSMSFDFHVTLPYTI